MTDPRSLADSPKTAARAAAEWWATQIGSPMFRVVGDRPGERDFKAMFFEAFAAAASAEHPVTEEAARMFAHLLEARIAADLAAEAERVAASTRDDPDAHGWVPNVGLYVDYGPDLILAEPAEAAGISLSRFPIKSVCSVYFDHVIGAVGYGVRRTLIWSTPEWEQTRPECADWRMTGWDVHPDLQVCGLLEYHDGECGEWKPDPSVCRRCGKPRTAHNTRAAYEADDRCRFVEAAR